MADIIDLPPPNSPEALRVLGRHWLAQGDAERAAVARQLGSGDQWDPTLGDHLQRALTGLPGTKPEALAAAACDQIACELAVVRAAMHDGLGADRKGSPFVNQRQIMRVLGGIQERATVASALDRPRAKATGETPHA